MNYGANIQTPGEIAGILSFLAEVLEGALRSRNAIFVPLNCAIGISEIGDVALSTCGIWRRHKRTLCTFLIKHDSSGSVVFTSNVIRFWLVTDWALKGFLIVSGLILFLPRLSTGNLV